MSVGFGGIARPRNGLFRRRRRRRGRRRRVVVASVLVMARRDDGGDELQRRGSATRPHKAGWLAGWLFRELWEKLATATTTPPLVLYGASPVEQSEDNGSRHIAQAASLRHSQSPESKWPTTTTTPNRVKQFATGNWTEAAAFGAVAKKL